MRSALRDTFGAVLMVVVVGVLSCAPAAIDQLLIVLFR
jgi:hypothetical protein